MGLGIAKIHQQPIADIAREISVKATDLVCACLLIGEDHLAQFFRIELFGERSGANQIAEHHRQLAALGFWGSTPNLWRLSSASLVPFRCPLGMLESCSCLLATGS